MLILVWMLAQVAAPADEVPPIERDCLKQLLTVRRIFVDRLNGGETADQMRDKLISSLQNSRLFVVTENQDRADAYMRGSAEDLVFTEQHSTSDSINAHANLAYGRSGYAQDGPNTSGRSSVNQSGGLGIGQSESMHSSERRHEASAAVRLVNKDGDVIWSTTEESTGGKFLGASADVANRITGKLADDYNKAKRLH
jgi:hypothetical protein